MHSNDDTTIKPSNLAIEVRTKNFKVLTREEHQFISIDCVLFPNLYKPGFYAFPRYDLKISSDRIIELIRLPKELQLAMGYMATQNEVNAHYIVNKYYVRISRIEGDEVLEIEDLTCTMISTCADDVDDPSLLSMKSIGKKLYGVLDCQEEMRQLSESKDDFFDLIATFSNNARVPGLESDEVKNDDCNEEIDFANIEDFANHDENIENHQVFIGLDDSIPLYQIQSTKINANEKLSYTLLLNDDDYGKKPSSITISIVCQGEYVNGRYEAARISAALKLIESQGSLSASSKNIGYAPYELQEVNSEKKLGHILLKYDFLEGKRQHHFPTKYMFQLDILAQSNCQFSVDVTCLAAYYAKDIMIHNFCEFFIMCKQKRLEEYKCMNTKLDQRILKRKISLLEDLMKEAELKEEQLKKEVDSIELEIELDAEIGINEDVGKLEKSKQLELEYAQQCRLIPVRQMAVKDTKIEIDHLEQSYMKHLALANQFQHQTNSSLQLLPRAIGKSYGRDMHERSQNVMMFVSSLRNQSSVHQTSKTIHRDSVFPSLSDEKDRKAKYRLLLQEIDRIHCVNDCRAASAMLHATPQLFPKDVLQSSLEMELNKMICKEILGHEKDHPLLLRQYEDNNDDSSSLDTFDSSEDFRSEEHNIRSFNDGSFPSDNSLNESCHRIQNEYRWKDPSEVDNLKRQRDNLSSDILHLMQERRKTIQLFNESNNEVVKLEERTRALTIVKNRIDEKLQLIAVDKELYDANKCTSKYFVVRSLHGYDTLMHRSEAIEALSSECDHLVAIIVSKEIVDDTLERMLEGYHFGILGRDKDDQKLVADMLISDTTNKMLNEINTKAKRRVHSELSFKHGSESLRFLHKSEKSLKIGFACLFLQYFNSKSGLQLEKAQWAKENDNDEKTRKSIRKHRKCTKERLKMIEEEKNIWYRKRLIKEANEKAIRGAKKKQMREKLIAAEKIRELNVHQTRITIQKASAIMIQCHYRGHLGRKVAKRWLRLESNIKAFNALCHGSAIAISRVFRGHRGRQVAAKLRKDLVEYIISIREAEIIDEEEEFWSNLRFGKWRRNRDCQIRQGVNANEGVQESLSVASNDTDWCS